MIANFLEDFLNLIEINYNVAYFLSFINIIVYAVIQGVLAVVYMLILTIVIAAITLVERNTLALVQRRVGPNQTAFRGRLQYLADALNLLNNSIFIVSDGSSWLFILWPCLALIAAYLFWVNALWNPNLSATQIEYNLLVMGILSFFFSVSILLISFYSSDKYCILSAVSSALLTATLELVWGVVVLIIISHLESFSFASVTAVERKYMLLFLLLAPAAPFVLLVFLLEAASIPFDLVEAESELVAGYSNELGGFFFALFYLGEYFHLFFASMFFAIIFTGL